MNQWVIVQDILQIVAGLVLMVFGIRQLSQGLQSLCSKAVRHLASNIGFGVLKGARSAILISLMLQSSSSLGVMGLGYGTSGLMSGRQLWGFFLGAQLSTALTLWLWAVPLGESVALSFLIVGALLLLRSSVDFLTNWGRVLFALGLMFLGFELASIDGLWFSVLTHFVPITVSNGILAFVLGALFAIVFQNTLGVVALIFALHLSGGLPVYWAGLALLGAQLASASVLIKSMKNSSSQAQFLMRSFLALKFALVATLVVLAPLIFNIISQWSQSLVGGDQFFVPMLHFSFQVVLIGVGILLTPLVEHFLNRQKGHIQNQDGSKEPQRLLYLGEVFHLSPSMGLEQVTQEIKKMAAMVQNILELTQSRFGLVKESNEVVDKVYKYERITDNIHLEVSKYLQLLTQVSLSRQESKEVRALYGMSDQLESIADCCEQTLVTYEQLSKRKESIHQSAESSLRLFLGHTMSVYELVFPIITEMEKWNESQWQALVDDFRQRQLKVKHSYEVILEEFNAIEGNGSFSLLVGKVLVNISRIADHTITLVEAYQLRR